jgi:polysaccharide export outer membrane protein
MKNMDSKNQLRVSWAAARCAALLLAALFAVTGCQTGQFTNNSTGGLSHPSIPSEPVQTNSTVLREGDTVHIAFPGSPSFDTTEQIRVDGKIMMPLVGEVTAAGKTPLDFQAELIKLYEPQLTTKQVVVTLQNPSFQVYVTGEVLRPGPVTANHPLTALDAIMEAGGYDSKANLKAVVVIRQDKNGSSTHTLDLNKVMQGGQEKPFYLKPSDIVRVPEKFTWF